MSTKAKRTLVPDEEVTALAVAYAAITSQPVEAWERMVAWLDARLAADLRAAEVPTDV